MFTGIVEEVGEIGDAQGGSLTVKASAVLQGVRLGDSIAVNGVCLTVVQFDTASFSVNVVAETLRRTNLERARAGDQVNLERAMPADGRFGGHMVQGHIEGTAEVVALVPDGPEDLMVRYRAPRELARYIVRKGFIAVDGASLTVVDCNDGEFSVALVPYTRQQTNLAAHQPAHLVNIETDELARYVERLLRPE